jgi:2-phosphoglycerate kinase
MAKTLVFKQQENTRVPFLRGILTHSLQDAGLKFDEAYHLASRIRSSLAKSAEITSEELRTRVSAQLQAHYDPAIAERYNALSGSPATILVRDQNDQISPFSRGRHRRFLESSGLSATEAATITTRIYEQLLQDGRKEIKSSWLGYVTHQHLLHELGSRAARRYLVWSEFLESGRPLLLLIGGTVGCGKSTIATEIAHRLDIVRTQSTDMLREVMRMMIPERLLPVLHMSSFNAWEALPFREEGENHDRLLAQGYKRQTELLFVPCEAVIQRALRERVSLILEGVHIQPSLLERIPRDADAIVICVMLAVLSPGELRRRLRGRSTQVPQRRADRYLSHFDPIWKLQSLLLSEADQFDVPIVPNDDKEKTIHQIMATINQVLSRQFHGSPQEVFGLEEEPAGRVQTTV